MKSWYKSKAIWIAIIQAIIGIVIAAETVYPDAGIVLIGKSILDIVLRVLTTTPIGTPKDNTDFAA